MDRLKRWWIAPVLGALLVGCQSNEAKKPDPTAGNGGGNPAETKTDPPKPEVPASYKHAGFDYYGLGSGAELKLELKRSGTSMTGGQTFTLEEVKPDGATYLQSWTGELAASGNTRLLVNDKGVYGIEAQAKKIDPPQLQMPADPKPGFTWRSDSKIELPGGSIDSTDNKVVGVKTVTIGGKPTEVLVIERTSKASLPNAEGKMVPQTLKAIEHYQKGVGAVKVEVTVSGAGVPTNTFSIEVKP